MDSFEEVLSRLDKFVWYLAHRFDKSIQGQEVEDLHQEGVIKLYEVYSSAAYTGKTPGELDAIFKICLWNVMRDLYATDLRYFECLEPLPVEELEDTYVHDAFVDVYVSHYQESLATKLSADSVMLLELLLNPTPAVYHMHNITVMRRKALRMQGKVVRIPTKITHEVVGSVLGFSLAKTKNLIRELKEAWRTECQTDSFKQNADTS